MHLLLGPSFHLSLPVFFIACLFVEIFRLNGVVGQARALGLQLSLAVDPAKMLTNSDDKLAKAAGDVALHILGFLFQRSRSTCKGA